MSFRSRFMTAVAAVLGHRRFGIDTELYEAGLDSLGKRAVTHGSVPDLKGFHDPG